MSAVLQLGYSELLDHLELCLAPTAGRKVKGILRYMVTVFIWYILFIHIWLSCSFSCSNSICFLFFACLLFRSLVN